MARFYTCDLHNHTCLSPCAGPDMRPPALVKAFLARGLDIVAITDHNSSENISSVMEAARDTQLVIIPGMEVTTREEAHMLALFETLDAVERLQETVYRRLPDAGGLFQTRSQAIVDHRGEIQGYNRHPLFEATDMAVEELTGLVHELSGIAVASHIDRSLFSILAVLGTIPPAAAFDALEISAALSIAEGRRHFPELASYCFVTASDAHRLEDVGRSCTGMLLEHPCFDEIRLALGGRDGRSVAESQA